MKKIVLPCLLAALGYAGWHHYKLTQQGDASRQAEQAQAGQPHVGLLKAVLSPVVAATPAPTPEPAAPTPAPVVSATPTPCVVPAGTFTKEELLAAINKDAKEPSLEKLLGSPNFKETTGWTNLYTWTGKLDTGSDTPESFTVEVAPYNGLSLVVGIHDPVSHSTTSLPWRAKVESDHKYWVQVWFDEQAATANKKAQLELYKQAARDTQRWAQAQRASSYVSPLSQPAVRVGPASDDQPRSVTASTPNQTYAGNTSTPHDLVVRRQGVVTGRGASKADAYTDALSQLPKGSTVHDVNYDNNMFYPDPQGRWHCNIDVTTQR